MWYVAKFDEASWQLLASVGLTRSLFREKEAGMVAVEQHIEYERELLAGDIVSVRSAVVEVMDKALRIS
jgi:acyl-CoA thioester hydrolase